MGFLGVNWGFSGGDPDQQNHSTPPPPPPGSPALVGQGGMMDPGTGKLLQDQYAMKDNTTNTYANQITDKVGQSSSNISQNDNENTNNSQGGNQADAGLGAAINAKAAKGYSNTLGAVTRQAQFQGALINASRSNDIANTQVQLANAQRGINSQMNEIQIQAQAAQYSLVGSLFKGAGTAAGLAAANASKPTSLDTGPELQEPELGGSEFGGNTSYLGGSDMASSLY